MLDTTNATAVLAEAVQLACRAPSLHNSQPWLWVADGDRLDLFLDSSRIVHGDQSAREALISCGAALDHLRVAMAAAGWLADIERFPNPDDPEHLAAVGFTPLNRVSDVQRRRADAILTRYTDRLPFMAPENWAPLENVLRDRVDEGLVRLNVFSGGARPELAETAQFAEALRLYDWAYHAELNWWTAQFAVSDGIPQDALVSAAESDRVDVGRVFPVTRRQERRTEVGDDKARMLMLSTDGDNRVDALACGEALSAVLLECTMAGLATCPLTHVTEVPASREVLATMIGHSGCPQVLVRVGSVPALDETRVMTPRRPLGDVLRVKG